MTSTETMWLSLSLSCPQQFFDYFAILYSHWSFLVKQWHEDWFLSLSADTKYLVETREKKLTGKNTFPTKNFFFKYSTLVFKLPSNQCLCFVKSEQHFIKVFHRDLWSAFTSFSTAIFLHTETLFQDKKVTFKILRASPHKGEHSDLSTCI